MTQSITVNGTDRAGAIRRVKVEWVSHAYLGEVGQGRLVIDDAAGTLTVPAYKSIVVLQDASTPSSLFYGFAHGKRITRGETFSIGAGREYHVDTLDGNDLLRRKTIRRHTGDSLAEGGKRPAESVGDRITWLLATGFLAASDYGAVTYPTDGMDADDYRGRYPVDVLQACAKVVRFNFYVRWNVANADWELVFRDDNASTDDTCTLSISNDLADVNLTTVFPPFMEAELTLDAEGVYSGAFYSHGDGNGYTSRAATATAFADRDGTPEDAGTKTAATAERDAQTFLYESRDEEQMLPVTIRLPKDKVGLVQAGQRINVTMTHMGPEGWDTGRYARILRLRVTQPQNTDETYDLAMDLSPQEDGPPVATIVQRAFGGTGEAGDNATLPNPVTVGNLLIFCASDRSGPNPTHPNTVAPAPKFGSGAWTLLNADTVVNRDVSTGDGIAFYAKVADSTERSGKIAMSNARWGIWEISCPDAAATLAAITTTEISDQRNILPTSQTLTTGSLGTLATGSLALFCTNWGDQTNGGGFPAETRAQVTAPSGWTIRLYDPSYYSGGVITENTPYTVIADAVGAGSALTASITRSKMNRSDDALDTFGWWCGMAVIVTPE